MPDNPFSDPEINDQIKAKVRRLQAASLERDDSPDGRSLDDHIVETLVETLDAHAEPYLRKVDSEDLISQYGEYMHGVGSALVCNVEQRGLLSDPYSEARLREIAENSGSLMNRILFLKPEERASEIQSEIERLRAEFMPKAVAWHQWRSQIRSRIETRFEARYRRWEADAIEQVQRGPKPTTPNPADLGILVPGTEEYQRAEEAIEGIRKAGEADPELRRRNEKGYSDLTSRYDRIRKYAGHEPYGGVKQEMVLKDVQCHVAEGLNSKVEKILAKARPDVPEAKLLQEVKLWVRDTAYKFLPWQPDKEYFKLKSGELTEALWTEEFRFPQERASEARSLEERATEAIQAGLKPRAEAGTFPKAHRGGAMRPSKDESARTEAGPAANGTNGDGGDRCAAEAIEGVQRRSKPPASKPRAFSRAANWEDIELSFIGDHDVEIRVGGEVQTVNYKELAGFEDRRTGKPTQLWAMLRVFGELPDGKMPDDARFGKQWEAIQKKVQRTSEALRRLFGMTGDPLPYIRGAGYHARIKIRLTPDSSR